jgi:antitoxin ParD1/3/4
MKHKVVTMNISLPATLRGALEKKVERQSYGTASEYVRDLIRKDLQREAIAQVDELLLEGIHSGKPVPITQKWWAERHAKLTKPSSRRRA